VQACATNAFAWSGDETFVEQFLSRHSASV
jgi:hypothetical protein